jgi:hypothetical protein
MHGENDEVSSEKDKPNATNQDDARLVERTIKCQLWVLDAFK